MLIDQINLNLLQILLGENKSLLSENFFRNLHLGLVLKGTVQSLLPQGKALVQFQGQDTVLQIKQPLQVGQVLTARVEQLAPVPILKLLSTSAAPQASGPGSVEARSAKPEQSFTTRLTSHKKPVFLRTLSAADLTRLKLSPRQDLSVTVSRVLKDQTLVVRFQEAEVVVHTKGEPPPLPGTTVNARVEPSGALWRLATLGARPEVPALNAQILRPYLPSYRPVSEMLARLGKAVEQIENFTQANVSPKAVERIRHTLQLLSPKTDSLPDGARIREQVDLSGIFYESKVKKAVIDTPPEKIRGTRPLRDLKGQLLELVRLLEAAPKNEAPGPKGSVPDVLQTFRQAVDSIELHQLANRLSRQENLPVLIQIPNPFASGDHSINIYMRHHSDADRDGKRKNKSAFNLVFILNLSALGNVRVDAQVAENHLSVDLTVENPLIAAAIDAATPDLQSKLPR